MAQLSLQGVFTALVTPFSEDASTIDFPAYEKLLEKQLEAGVAGVVPCGTTGETPTLSGAEQLELIRFTKRFVGSKVPVIAGTGSNATQKSIDASKAALEAGADAIMIVMPYYNKPNQAGMIRHVEQIAANVAAPIVLYNIPGRCGVELSAKSTLTLLESCPNVVAVKDATGGLDYSQQVLSRAQERLTLLSGDDPLTLPMLAVGAAGVISVASNLYPGAVVRVVEAFLRGDYAAARKAHFRLLPVFKALFCEPNPAPVKAAMAHKGWMHASVRSPIVSVSSEARALIVSTMKAFDEGAA